MKPTPLMLIIIVVVSGILFWVSLLGTAFFIIAPNVSIPAKFLPKKVVAKKKVLTIADVKDVAVGNTAPSVEGLTAVAEQFDAWRKELDVREKKALQMDEDLTKRKAVLDAEKETLKKEREKLLKTQTDFESRVLLIEENEGKRFEEIAQLFTKMNPAEVVNYMRVLPEAQITRLMTYIPKKQLVKVLESWSQAFPDDRDKVSRMMAQTRLVIKPGMLPAATSDTKTNP